MNSININKTNNHPSSELKSVNTKKATTYHVGNLGPDLGQPQKNRLMGTQPSLLKAGTPTAMHIRYTNNKKAFHSTWPPTITKVTDNINMDSTIAGSTIVG